MKLCKTKSKISLLSISLLLLSGCIPFFNSKDNTSSSSSAAGSSLSDTTLMTIDGEVAITVQEYEDFLEAASSTNPQIAMVVEAMPNGEKDFVFNSYAASRLMKAWAEKNGVTATKEFLQEQKQAYDLVDLQLYFKYYDEAHPIHISDKDLKAFYEEKKDRIPGLVVSSGGVSAQFARFDSREEAQSFYNAVENVSAEQFVEEAKSRYATVQDALINSNSQYSPIIKKFAEKISETPYVEVVKVSENSYWVIQALDKTEAEYRPLNSPEVKEGLRQMLMEQKKSEQMESNIEALKEEMNVVENSVYFEQKAAHRAQAREEDQMTESIRSQMEHNQMQQALEEDERRHNTTKM